jgi:hypothetical protein
VSSNFKDEKRIDKDFLDFQQTVQIKNAPHLQAVLLSGQEIHEESLKIK